MKLTDEYNENVRFVNNRYKMSRKITLNYGIPTSFITRKFQTIFLNTEKTYGDGTIMVYTKTNVQLTNIKRIETGSDSAFNGKVLSSFERISRIRKNITIYN